jgi:hypothetical protein
VITIDAVGLQSSGIELPDSAGFAAELALGITVIVPELIEAAVGFSFNADLIVSRVGSGFDQMLAFCPRLTWSEESDIYSRLRLPFCAFHSIIADGELVH